VVVLSRLPLDTAFVAMLRNNLGKDVYYGDSDDPHSGVPPEDATLPYAVVYSITGGAFYAPSLTGAQNDAEFLFQVTCVGGTSAQAAWLDDKVRDIILGRTATGAFTTPLTPAGMTVNERESQTGTSGTTRTRGRTRTRRGRRRRRG